MEVILRGEPKEIASLVGALQARKNVRAVDVSFKGSLSKLGEVLKSQGGSGAKDDIT